MRRVLSVLAPAAWACAVALAGCGGSDDAGSPLDSALAYLPKDVALAVAVETDLEGSQYKSLDKMVEKFPFSDQLKQGLTDSIEESGTDFERDVRPLLGNPIVFGIDNPRAVTSGSDASQYVAAVQVKDKDKLDALLDKEKAKEQGEKAGATVYKDDQGDYLAVEGDVLVFGSSRAELEQALERRDGDDQFSEEDFDNALEGLPKEALVRLYTDVEALLGSDPGTRDAQKVKWVKALRTFGLTGVAKGDDALDVDFELTTDGELSDADLPIASGDEAPGVLRRPGEIGLGVRNLAQIIEFAESAGQAVDPSGYGDYAAAKRQIEQRLGVSIDDDLLGQLKGDTAMSIAVDGKFGMRSELEDPAAFERTLAQVADLLPAMAEGAGGGSYSIAKPRRGSDFYALAGSNGDRYVFGVVDDVFVLANDASRAGRLASESPTPVSGAKGSVAMSADAEQLAGRLLGQLAPQLGLGSVFGAGLFTSPLDELTGSLSATPEGMRGSFELSLD